LGALLNSSYDTEQELSRHSFERPHMRLVIARAALSYRFLSVRTWQCPPVCAEVSPEIARRMRLASVFPDCTAQGCRARRRGLEDREALAMDRRSVGISAGIALGHRTPVNINTD
jgi:hypothetical protein